MGLSLDMERRGVQRMPQVEARKEKTFIPNPDTEKLQNSIRRRLN